MFALYAIPIGIAIGYLLGGRLDRLAGLQFRLGWLAIVGLLAQVVLFSGGVAELVDERVGAILYVASTAAVLIAVLVNLRIQGLAVVAVGAIANLAAVVANGGVMPTTRDALATAGLADRPGFSNSAVIADPMLEPLTDIFALPAWVPLANVFSVGDVLIGVGIAAVLAIGMRRAPADGRLNRSDAAPS
jgi:hypothetical protein